LTLDAFVSRFTGYDGHPGDKPLRVN
jgi:hypothetical protein